MKISNPIDLTTKFTIKLNNSRLERSLTASFYIYKSTVAALVFFLKFTLSGFSRSEWRREMAARWRIESTCEFEFQYYASQILKKLIFIGSSKNNKSVDPLTNGRSPSLISLMIRKLSPPFSPVNIVSNNPRQPDNRQLCEPSVVGVRSINSTYGLSRTVCNSAAASDIESPNCRVICKRKCQQDFPLLIIFTFAHF
ncbi:hypothetical protein T05_2481 [Trichinella murrelli]|uniref:Uncharacterized protein n=1 Tax=Trichinella murrelli TaxID=144512 RepID=A0A0V0U5P7_9BILA|nr:hypothetical protein T05_2481 [Trichinella murrelli]